MKPRNKSAKGERRGTGPRATGDASDGPRPEGILVLDKPAGLTSMSAVAAVRRRAGGVKTGHAGTLDPLATGVLVVALSRATKLIGRLMATPKRYRTIIDLTAFTTTDDTQGERTEVHIDKPPSDVQVATALTGFHGSFQQKPPAFSAVKIRGRRAYKLARRGAPAEIPPRDVTVYELKLIDYRWPLVELAIHCGKGFYVRSLARDLGLILGTGGHCASIRRTAVGPFTLEMAMPLDEVPQPLTQKHLIAPSAAMRMLEKP